MCESIAYLLTEQGEEKIMDNVVYMVHRMMAFFWKIFWEIRKLSTGY
jgi:hypothetical protein